MNKTIYCGLDIGKLFAAIAVVLLHTVETSAWWPSGVKYVATQFAVPFFFISSGFFFYKGLTNADNPGKYIVRYEKHLLKVLFVWELIIYLPFTIQTYLSKYEGLSLPRLLVLIARRILIIGSGPYWYLNALLWSAAFLYLCSQMKCGKRILIIGMSFGMLLKISYSCFRNSLSEIPYFRLLFNAVYLIWSLENNFIMLGIPFMGAGWLLAEHRIKWSARKALTVFMLSTAFRIFEYNISILFPSAFWTNNSLSLAFIPQALAFFLLMKDWMPDITKDQSLTIRQLSSTIYYTHAIFLYELLNPLMDHFTNLPTYSGVMITPKVIITVSLSALFFLLIKKIDKPSLNILING